LDAPTHKVKELAVRPGHRLSYQMHAKRSEHWFVVAGDAIVTINDNEAVLREGESVNVPAGTKHRIENRSDRDVVFIEVQTGSYFGEDDIVRFDDDYNRV
jgi:mannose-6-phosphate isomerase